MFTSPYSWRSLRQQRWGQPKSGNSNREGPLPNVPGKMAGSREWPLLMILTPKQAHKGRCGPWDTWSPSRSGLYRLEPTLWILLSNGLAASGAVVIEGVKMVKIELMWRAAQNIWLNVLCTIEMLIFLPLMKGSYLRARWQGSGFCLEWSYSSFNKVD